MARNLAALRAALGGLAGAAAGFSAQKAAEEERKRIDTETKRREALDLATLQASGWMAPEQRTQRLQAASPALQSAFSTAASIMGGGTGGASLAAPPTKEQQQSLTGAAGLLREPAGRITIGGRELVLPETSMQAQERMRLSEEARSREEAERLRQEKLRLAAQERSRRISDAQTTLRTPDGKQLSEQQAAFIVDNELLSDPKKAGILGLVATVADPEAKRRNDLLERRIALQERALASTAKERDMRGARLPIGAQTKIANIESGLIQTDDLVEELKRNPNAVGMKNYAWKAIVDRLDPQGVGLRASIEALSGQIRNERFGGALSKTEAGFAATMLPSDTDSYKAATAKLNRLTKYLNAKKEGIYRAHESAHGRQPQQSIQAPQSVGDLESLWEE